MLIYRDRITYGPDGEGAGAGGAEAAAGGKTAVPEGAAPGGSSGGVDGDAGDGGAGDGVGAAASLANSNENYWPEDWATRMASAIPAPKGEKEAKAHAERVAAFFKTRSNPGDVLKAAFGADSKISELTASMKGMVKLPGKDAKPEDVAAFRKVKGVPETADKYAVYRPDGYEPTEADTEAEKTFLEAAHGMHLGQSEVDALLKTHYAIIGHQQRQQVERAKAAGEAAIEDLRAEYGRDYKANIALADRWLATHLAEDMGEDWKGLMGLRFGDGTALGEKPGFVKAIVRLAKASADDGAFDMGEGGGVVDVDTEINAMMSKMGTDEYKSAAFQQKLDGLIARKSRRSAA